MKRFLIGCIGVLAAASAHAQTADRDSEAVTTEDFVLKDAGDLLELCNVEAGNEVAKEAIHFCHGFISGTYRYHESLAPKFGRVVCPPEGVTRNDGVRIFTDFLRANPQHRKGSPTEVLMESWTANYPCRP
jgi:hypothetical protein